MLLLPLRLAARGRRRAANKPDPDALQRLALLCLLLRLLRLLRRRRGRYLLP